ncbi:MAG TPA: outer membrane beta-barrel protein, partial [Longimicrobiales bacterium]|nr:outer membrane beta-barrel protein [Longimicrobiales bacterium]
MPSTLRGSLLPLTVALVLAGAAPTAARAQDKPIDLGGSGQSLEDLTGEGSTPLQITGFGVGDYSYDHLTGDNSARAGKLALALFREVNDRVWFFGQLTTALGTPEAGADEVPTEIEIDNLLVNFTPGGASGLSLAFGKFDVPLGFERDDEPLNFQATNSFNYELGRPAKMVGLVGRWAVSPHVDLTALGGNGWDAQVDPNHGKTGGARLGLIPNEHASFGVGGLFGAEGEPGDLHNRFLLSADYALEVGNDWILGGEANLGGEPKALDGGGDARWYGATVSLFHRLSRHVGATVRGETFRDRDGLRTGVVQTLQSITFTPMVFVG